MKISIWPNQAVREFHTRTRITEDYLSSSLSLDNNDELVSIFFNLPGVIQRSEERRVGKEC